MFRKYAEVSRLALISNIEYVKTKLKENTKVLACVKADAYGHGAVECAKIFLENGADYLGVSSLGEGIRLREGGVNAPILVFGFIQKENLRQAIENDLICTIISRRDAKDLDAVAGDLQRIAKVHIKIDTGMGRIGFGANEVGDILKLGGLKNIEIEGIYTHFACEGEAEIEWQFRAFEKVMRELSEGGMNPPIRHACNSAAIFAYPRAHLDMVRAGIALYGYGGENLSPAMSFKTIIINKKSVAKGAHISYGWEYVALNDEVIATIPIGYADGYTRRNSGVAEVIIGGMRQDVVGNICMDQCMVRLDGENARGAGIGDEVVLIGEQGDEAIWAEEMANWTGTISYEVLCAIGKRIPRTYV